MGRSPALVRGGDIIDFIARGVDDLANWSPASDPLKNLSESVILIALALH